MIVCMIWCWIIVKVQYTSLCCCKKLYYEQWNQIIVIILILLEPSLRVSLENLRIIQYVLYSRLGIGLINYLITSSPWILLVCQMRVALMWWRPHHMPPLLQEATSNYKGATSGRPACRENSCIIGNRKYVFMAFLLYIHIYFTRCMPHSMPPRIPCR